MKMRLTFYDKLFASLVVVFSLVLFVMNIQLSADSGQRYISVHVDNEFVMEISFDDSTNRQVEIPFGADGENIAILELGEGKVRMLPMDKELCPRGICSHTGWISRDYQSIVCVPNRIVVAFSEQKQDDGVDGVTF